MSRKVAPGEWDAAKRELSKAVGFVLGALLIWYGLDVVQSIANSGEVTMWSVILAAIPIGIGATACFPKLVPMVYRIIDEIDGRRQGGPDA